MLALSLVLSLSRWSITLVLPSMWPLLQEPQGWRRGREWHLLQRALHLQLWEPVRSQLSPGDRHLRAGQPPVTPSHQRANPGQAAEKGPCRRAPTVRTSAKEWLAAHAYSKLPRHQQLQEEASEREVDSWGGAGKVHSRLPEDQDPREVPWEEVHVAGRPAEKVPPLSQETGLREQTHEAKHQFTSFFDQDFFNKREKTLNSFESSFWRIFILVPEGWKSTRKLERSIKNRLFFYWHM